MKPQAWCLYHRIISRKYSIGLYSGLWLILILLTHFLLWSVRLHLTLVYMTIWYQQISELHQSMEELGYQQIFLNISKTEIDLTSFKGSIIALWCNWMRLHFYWKCHVADWIFTVYYLNHVAMFFLTLSRFLRASYFQTAAWKGLIFNAPIMAFSE